ncbi:hypothetical protein CDG81_16620 [Actinopolyspora erythraea]|uniref:PE domain-containing protein n=1 Tax=Actinopolyspora erythraea TaxID=414996 RepID=A0A099D2C9_9ACTN|nr:hypothetical protein [Actinopolyspora erythraea]ASU79622.1 hypothetical protein CDG81_16620 [Actinopolyspora erythraea]KGI79455.1 hypothetical protein IL38_23495 [Actinopolyspora erythraea]
MTPPDSQAIEVALDAMRSDAEVWRTAAGDLTKPADTVDGLTLTAADVSVWAAEHGFDSTYEQARVTIRQMLSKAEEYFRVIGDNLNTAADQYENDYLRAAENLNGISSEMGEN